jgi:hypothetical protein
LARAGRTRLKRRLHRHRGGHLQALLVGDDEEAALRPGVLDQGAHQPLDQAVAQELAGDRRTRSAPP